MRFSTKFLPLVPAFWACLFDVAVTVFHQAPEYWDGNLNTVNEGNPIGNIFMKNHVSGIFVITAIELIIIVVGFRFLPAKLGRVFLLFVVIAHTSATFTWLHPRYGFWSLILLSVINTVVYITANEKSYHYQSK
jgi:hypothetical protein